MQKSVYILAFAVFFGAVLSGCETRKYGAGSYVKHKLDGRVGIVIYYDGMGDQYSVRFSAPQATTDTHLLWSDGTIKQSPYADVVCKEFELEPVERPPATGDKS